MYSRVVGRLTLGHRKPQELAGEVRRVCRSRLLMVYPHTELATDGPRIYGSGSANEDLEGPSRNQKCPSLGY